MSANFDPTMGNFKNMSPFKMWCQKVLPLTYDDSLSYYEVLCKLKNFLNEVIENMDVLHDDVDALHLAYQQLEGYVNSYFDNLNVQTEINNKLDAMALDGSLSALISPFVAALLPDEVASRLSVVVESQLPAVVRVQLPPELASQLPAEVAEQIPALVTAWLNLHITQPVEVVIDDSLSIQGAAADAKAAGDAISLLNNALNDVCEFTPSIVDKIITQNSDELTFYGKGSISLVGGRYTSNSDYDTFLWTPTEQTDLYITRIGGTFLRIVEYNATLTTLPSSNTNQYFVRGGGYEASGENTLPSINNRWTVPAGHTIAITRINATYVSNFNLVYSASVNIKTLADDIIIPDDVMESNEAFETIKNISLDGKDLRISHTQKEGTRIAITEDYPSRFVFDRTHLTGITGSNRFDISNKNFTKSSDSSDATVTKTATGVKVVSNDTSGSNRYVYFNMSIGVTGKYWISCVASCATDKTNDCRMQIVVNGVETAPDCVGVGLLKRYVNVTEGDTVQVRLWYHLYTSSNANTVEYNDIMLSYADCPFEPYVDTRMDLKPKKGSVLMFSESETVKYIFYETVNKLKVVCFGDSITGMFDYGSDYCYLLEQLCPTECTNVGFSGSTWADHPSTHYVPFSINRLIDSVVTNNFDYQDEHVGSIDSDFYAEHLANLKAIDFSKVDAVTFLAGTNDWAFNIPLLSENDPSESNKQRTNIEDAVTYSISQLLAKYRHLVIIVLCPYWRNRTGTEDSNVTPNSNGVYLYEVSDTIQKCAEGQNQKSINLYRTLGANYATKFYYTIDGTHPNTRTKKAIAERIRNAIKEAGIEVT